MRLPGELSRGRGLIGLRAARSRPVADLLDAQRNPRAEPGLWHVALARLCDALQERVAEVHDLCTEQDARRPGAGVEVHSNPVGVPAQPPAAAAANRFPEAGVGVVVKAPGEVEADLLMVVPEPPRLALGCDHPPDERFDGTAVGAVGGVGGEGDVDLVGDLQAGHAPHRPELAHHAPDEAQPPGDVTVVGRRGVVAHLQLHL